MIRKNAKRFLSILLSVLLVSSFFTMNISAAEENVASIGDVYYNSVEEALNAAVSGDTVIVQKDTTITQNVEVKKGVTLLVPYKEGYTGYNLSSGKPDLNTENKNDIPDVLCRNLTVAEGVTITVNGIVHVTAIIGEADAAPAYQGVNGDYAQITLNGYMIVNNGGKVVSDGYIKGSGTIEAFSGAEVRDLFVIDHWRGGSHASGMRSKVWVANEYDMHNIQCKIVIHHGAIFSGLNIMRVSSQFTFNEVIFVGDSEGIFITQDGSYVEKTYEYRERLGKNAEVVKLFGGGHLGQISLKVAIGEILGFPIEVTFNSSSYVVSLDGDYELHLYDGTYGTFTGTQEINMKFLPGSELIVHNGATFKIQNQSTRVRPTRYSSMVFYRELLDDGFGTSYRYPQGRPSAKLRVENGGTLSISGGIGGEVYLEENAIVTQNEDNGYTAPKFTITTNESAKMSTSELLAYTNEAEFIPPEGYHTRWEGNQLKIEKHTYGNIVADIEPTCTTAGSGKNMCTYEGCNAYVPIDSIPATGHNYQATVTAPTCTAQGYTTHTCANCGDSYVDTYVTATGHKYTSKVTAPTCTTDGYTTYTCSCGDSYTSDKVSSTGHSYTEKATSPTCTAEGYTTHTCSVCGESYVSDYVDALGHAEVTETVDATCTEKGKVTVSCSVCGEVISTEVIPATGHSFGDWEVTKYPTFDTEGVKTKSCSNCDAAETEVLSAIDLTMFRVHEYEIEGNRITMKACANADNIAFNRKTKAGSEIFIETYYDEEDLADVPTPIKRGDESERWIVYFSRWIQYAENGEYTTPMIIDGVEYILTISFTEKALEAEDIVLSSKYVKVNIDNENKVITLVPPEGADEVTFNEVSRQCKEFTYDINAENDENVVHNSVSGNYRGSYTIKANGAYEVEKVITLNKGRYCQTDYTLRVIFAEDDVVECLKPMRGALTMEEDEAGKDYLKVTMLEGKTAVGLYKDASSEAIEEVSIEFAKGNVIERDDLYVAYKTSNVSNPEGVATITFSNGNVVKYDIVFDMGIVESDADPLSELKLIRTTASFDADGTLRITRNAGLASSAGVGFYAVTTAGEAVTFTAEQGTVYAGRTDAYIAYLTQNTSNVKGVISYKLSDGTVFTCDAIVDLGLGDEYTESQIDIVKELVAIRGTVSVVDNTVTVTMAQGKLVTGVYNTTAHGYTVEIKDVNGTVTSRTDAYVAYASSNSANVEGTMVITTPNGTVYEYTVIFDLGL